MKFYWNIKTYFVPERGIYMNTLFEKSIRTLELPAVLSMLAALAVSDAA